MIDRILAIARKEFFQVWRDKRSLGLLAFVPTFTLLLFGFALSLDVKYIRLSVVDEDHTRRSRELFSAMLHGESFVDAGALASRSEVQSAIESNTADAVLVIPDGFAERLARGERATVQVVVDGANANVAAAASGYVDAYTRAYGAELQAGMLERAGRRLVVPVDYRPRVWFNPELKSSRYLVPGLMGYVLIITTVISTALSIVREKERGTYEQIMVSPATIPEFMIGKLIPYAVIAAILAVGVIAAGWLLFDVPVRGSIPMLALSLGVFIVGGLGMGMLISTLAQSQEAAFLLSVVTTALPTQLLSGFIFPVENMPAFLQAVSTIVPAKYLLTILRTILLKGAPLDAYWTSLLALVVFAMVTLSGAVVRLRIRR